MELRFLKREYNDYSAGYGAALFTNVLQQRNSAGQWVDVPLVVESDMPHQEQLMNNVVNGIAKPPR